jgi:RNA polymerase sigma factor (sigma-70 family)
MAMRFPAFKQIRTRKRKTVIKLVRVDSEEYDRSLFPVTIPSALQGELITGLNVPSILRNKFDQQGIARLGQLQGLEASTFLSWRGFGPTCFSALCIFVRSIRSGEINRLPSPESELTTTTENLSSDILSFPLDKLNLSTLLKSQFKSQFRIETVQDFLNAYDHGRLARPGIGTKMLQQIFAEIESLTKRGSQNYLEQITLENQSFLRLIVLAKEKLTKREQIIFDHRFVPLEGANLTLEALAQQFGLTRERVRQIEKGLVTKFQSGTLREFGWAIRRKAIELFKQPDNEFTFDQFMASDFFNGYSQTDSKVPAPVMFLDKVFYGTFTIDKKKILLTETTRRKLHLTNASTSFVHL